MSVDQVECRVLNGVGARIWTLLAKATKMQEEFGILVSEPEPALNDRFPPFADIR